MVQTGVWNCKIQGNSLKIILSHEDLKIWGNETKNFFPKICPKIGDFLARRPLCVCFLCRKSASSLVWPAFSNVFSIVDVWRDPCLGLSTSRNHTFGVKTHFATTKTLELKYLATFSSGRMFISRKWPQTR